MSVRRAIKRAAGRWHTFYHFTTPSALPSILQNGIYPHRHADDNPQLPGGLMAIWLTSDPNGNRITDEHLAYYERVGCVDLVEDCRTEKRRLAFGVAKNGDGSVRLTVQLPRKFPGLCNYLNLIREVYRDWPPALKFITEMPDTANWWVVISPAIAETFTGIAPAAIADVAPVGGQTAAYLEAIEQIRAVQEATP